MTPGSFHGAVLPIGGAEVLLVAVRPCVFESVELANLYVAAFHERFRRTIVLVAVDEHGAPPRCYGPGEILRVLGALPFEMIPWRCVRYRTEPPPSWRLPIPKDHDDDDDSAYSYSASCASAPRPARPLGSATGADQTRDLR